METHTLFEWVLGVHGGFDRRPWNYKAIHQSSNRMCAIVLSSMVMCGIVLSAIVMLVHAERSDICHV